VENDCKCLPCSPAPVVVLSIDERPLCRDHSITLRNVKEYIDGGLVESVAEESYIIYSQGRGDHVQTGICAAVDVYDGDDVIKRHECTISSNKQPRAGERLAPTQGRKQAVSDDNS
jgi:Protein of unknown function (DUF1015)